MAYRESSADAQRMNSSREKAVEFLEGAEKAFDPQTFRENMTLARAWADLYNSDVQRAGEPS